MKELSLFSGAGGGLLGTKLLGWETIGYVEFNDYCQRVLKQRILDGIFDKAPIFGDIRTFISEGYAESYKGMVDVITAGFPCQPFSVAGKGLGVDDPRNMWPQTKDCISIVRPEYCFLENVPGLLTHGYIRRIFGDLAEMGYDCKWMPLRSSQSGAPIQRERLWIVGWSTEVNVERLQIQETECFKIKFWRPEPQGDIQNVETSWIMANDYGTREFNEVPNWVDRIEAIGNAQSPNMARAAWKILTSEVG